MLLLSDVVRNHDMQIFYFACNRRGFAVKCGALVCNDIFFQQKMKEELGKGDSDKDQDIILRFCKVSIST